jgi:hypothetical protein
MLCAVDPAERPDSIEQVLQHPYLNKHTGDDSTQHSIKVLQENLDLWYEIPPLSLTLIPT